MIDKLKMVCGNCFFNGGRPEFLRDTKMVLCHRDPPHPDQGEKSLRHIYPVVNVNAKCCSGWRDLETLATLDDVMEEIAG